MSVYVEFQIIGLVILIIGLAFLMPGLVFEKPGPSDIFVGATVAAIGVLLLWGPALLNHEAELSNHSAIYTPDVEPQKPAILKE